ncbi:AAA family ATPase [Bacteroides sp.]|uniref:AAA family ATPase n=1 Tax=Bacteroides sp. TaxID=29523 RepID=UPI002FC5DE50
MKIKSLRTSKYKNLHDVNINFEADLITLLVGQNGLGKSNLIEILTFIFKDLYTIREKKEFIASANKSELSDYMIEYECRGNQLKIDYHDGQLEIYIKHSTEEYQQISFAKFKRNSDIFLPDRIMGYYSGENKRLEKLLSEYTSKEKRTQQRAYRNGSINKKFRNIFFSENRHSQLILFTLVVYRDHPVIGKAVNRILSDVLGLDEMIGFEIRFKNPSFVKLQNLIKSKSTLEDYVGEILTNGDFNTVADKDIFWGIKGRIDTLMRLFLIEYLDQSACHFYVENNREYFAINEQLMSYDTLVDKIYTVFSDPLDFFDALEAASSIGVLDELKLEISKIGDGEYYNFTALSEGEQQLISVLGLMAILREDNEEVLYLIDEPDTHINPKWQRNFVKLLLDNIGDSQHRHMFISTHSPFLVQAYDENVDILLFRRDEEQNKVIIDIADHTIKNWRIDQVLMSPYFDIESTRPSSIDDFMTKRLAIIRKGEFTDEDKAELLGIEKILGSLPTGETLTELESLAYINKAANRFREEAAE